MTTSPVLFAFFACFVLCGLTFSQPMQQTSAQEWNQKIKDKGGDEYGPYMVLVLGAASAGRNLVQQTDPLTSDCIRTARVIMNSLCKPSTMGKTSQLVKLSIHRGFNDTAGPNRNSAQLLCEKVNELEKLSNYTINDFEELKNKVELPKPEKDYILEVPHGKNLTQFFKLLGEIKDADLLRLATMVHFDTWPESDTVFDLAQRDALRSTVDAVFTQALDDYVKEVSTKQITVAEIFKPTAYKDFLKLVDEYFMRNEQLKVEYKKLMDKIRPKEPSIELTSENPSDQKPIHSLKLRVQFHK